MANEDFYDLSKLDPYDIPGELVWQSVFLGVAQNYPIKAFTVPYYALFLYAGDNRSLRVYVKDPDLNIINLTGAVGRLYVKTNHSATTATITKATDIAGQGAIGTADEGEMFFYLVPSDTATLTIQQYVFSIRVTLATGKTYTVTDGVINLKQPVG